MGINDFLKPLDKESFTSVLTKESFTSVLTNVCGDNKCGNCQRFTDILSMLDLLLEPEGCDRILNEMLSSITLKTGELLNADRVTIFIFDEEQNELWARVAKDENGKSLEIRVPSHVGIAGEVATEKKVVNIPYDFYNDSRSANAKKVDEKTGYRTYTMLVMPVINEETNKLVGVVQLINKLKLRYEPDASLDEKIDRTGFTAEDEQVFTEFAPSIHLGMAI